MKKTVQGNDPLQLGAFSVSLAVKDLAVSQAFYEKLGFEVAGGDGGHYCMMRNGEHVIGLFQGLFEGNILTFNPGWDQSARNLDRFADVREIQAVLKARGVALCTETDAAGTGPASISLEDPDGNAILIDQHRQAD